MTHAFLQPCPQQRAPPSSARLRGAGAAPRLALVVSPSRRASLRACGRKDAAGRRPGRPGAGGPPPALPVTVVDAQPTKVPVTVETVGQSEGSKEIQVRARVSGILLKQRFTEGDRVKAGAVLYQIDPEPYQIALAQAKAALAQAQASSEQAVREQNRLKPLAAEQAVSGKDYDDAQSAAKTAAAQVMARAGRRAQRRAEPELHAGHGADQRHHRPQPRLRRLARHREHRLGAAHDDRADRPDLGALLDRRARLRPAARQQRRQRAGRPADERRQAVSRPRQAQLRRVDRRPHARDGAAARRGAEPGAADPAGPVRPDASLHRPGRRRARAAGRGVDERERQVGDGRRPRRQGDGPAGRGRIVAGRPVGRHEGAERRATA